MVGTETVECRAEMLSKSNKDGFPATRFNLVSNCAGCLSTHHTSITGDKQAFNASICLTIM